MEIHVPKAFHRTIVGTQGANVKAVQSKFDVRVRVPAPETSSTLIIIEGARGEEAAAFIQEKLGFELSREPLKTAKLLVTFDEAKQILGDKAQRLNDFQSKYGVGVMLPRPDQNSVLVQGGVAGVEGLVKAWSEILGHSIAEDASAPKETVAAPKENIHLAKIAEALFFGEEEEDDDHDLNRFIQFLKSGDRTLDIAIFTLTHDRIARAILDEHRSGVKVRILTDNHTADALGSDVRQLSDAGIAVKIDTSEGHFHHKFCVIDNKVLMNGSFNWTRGASTINYENVMVTNDSRFVSAYSTEFEKMWNDPRFIVY